MAYPILRPLGRVFSTAVHRPRGRLAAAAVIVALLGTLSATGVLGAMRSAPLITAQSAPNASPDWCGEPGIGAAWEPGVQTISGRVTDQAVTPVGLGGITVEIDQLPYTLAGESVQTNADGTYAKPDLPDGSYMVKFFDQSGAYQSGFYAGAGAPLSLDPTGAFTVVLNSNDATASAALPAEAHFDISGSVKDSAGTLLDGARLTAEAVYFPMASCADSVGGAYDILAARVGVYRIKVTSPGNPDGYYSSGTSITHFVTSEAAATLLTVATSDLTGIDIQFPPTFSLSGTVVDGDGNVPPGMHFAACETTTNYCQYGNSDDASGAFTIPLIVAGTYTVSEGDEFQAYRVGYYGGDGVFAPTLAEATPISVSANVTGINMLAVLAPTVSGTVTDSGGTGLDDIYVDLCKVTDSFDCVNPATTFGGGTFKTGGVQPGTYTLFVRDSRDPAEYASGYLSNAGTLLWDPLDPNVRQITVGDTDVGSVNVTIQDGGHIAATVMKGTDVGLGAWVIVCLSPEVCLSGGQVNDTGTFTSAPLIAPSYIVGVATNSTDWYVLDGVATDQVADATPVAVSGLDTTSITIHMPLSFTETGTAVAVAPAYDGATNPVDLTFGTVDYAGTTTLTTSTSAPALPTGYQLSGSLYYDITTTAGYSGTIKVCISLTGLSPVPTTMMHYDESVPIWQDITTTSSDPTKICGETTSLSPFALVVAPVTSKQVVMGPQAMEGDLKVAMGSTLKVGYDFSIPKKHVAQTVSFVGAHVDFAYTCVAGPSTPKKIKPVGSGTISVAIPNGATLDPANSSAWYPTAKATDPLTYQGSLVLATDLCTANGLVRLQAGGSFFFGIASDGNHEKINVRWHYSANGSAGNWSSTLGVTPY
jgi:hypothetical protein